MPISKPHDPLSKEKTNCAQKQRRDAKDKIGQAGRLIAIVALVDREDVFHNIVKAAPKFPQAINENEKTGSTHKDTKKFGRFHVHGIKFRFAFFGKWIASGWNCRAPVGRRF